MKSIFNESKEVTVDGTEYRVEADVTMEGTQMFKVTNLETGNSDSCVRDGNVAKIDSGMRGRPFDFREVLEAVEEVEVN